MTTRLYIKPGVAVFAARVNQATFEYPLNTVDYDTVMLGAYTDIRDGMTVLFGSSALIPDDLGRQRVRSADATTLTIGRSSNGTNDGEVNLADDAWIIVLDEYRVWSKIPYITDDGTIYKDGDIVFSDQTDDIPPKANGGVGMAGDISGGVLTVDFSSAASYSPVGAAISTILWDVEDGTITVGTSASASITATFPAGFRYVHLTVTDANGKSHTVHIPVYARDPASDTTIGNFQIERHTIRKDGQELSLRILEDIDEGTYPDGTLVMIWEDEPASASDRSHMRFIGWHHTDPAQIQAERTGILKDTTFECLDVAGKLKTLPGFPVSVEGNASPSSWLEMSNPNMDKYIDFLLRWHSTALEVAPLTLSGTGSNYPFVILGSDAGSLWEQAAKRAQALVPDYLLTCNTKGAMAIKTDPMIQYTGDRTATVQVALTEADWSDVRYTHQRPPRVHWLRSEAVLASASTIAALFCVAPDNTPGQGISEQPHGEQLAISQDGLNVAEGNRYGRLNAADTYFSITLAQGDDKSIEPADMTWVTMAISAAAAAQRGLTLSTARGLVHQIDIRYSYGRTGMAKTVTLTWEKETSGLPAITFIPPATNIDIDYEPLPDPGYDPYPITAGDGFGTCYVMDAGYLLRTRDLSAASPIWVDIAPVDANSFNDWILDSWNPTTTGYLVSDSGVWKSTDLDLASPSFSQVLTAAAAEMAIGASASSNWFYVFTTINIEDYVAVFFQATVGGTPGVYCARSTNAGSTWSYANVMSNANLNGWYGAVDYVPHLVGGAVRIYVCSGAGTNNSTPSMFRSDDSGATWSNVGTVATALSGQFIIGRSIHVPYTNNPSGATVYCSLASGGALAVLRKSVNAGATWASAVSLVSAILHRRAVETHTQDDQSGFYWSGTLTLKTTSNGFSSTNTPGLTGLSGTIYASGGFPYTDNQFYAVTSAGIFVTTDGGENWVDKTGDWVTAISARCVIVPVWVAE